MTINAEHTGNCAKDLADGAWRGAEFANIGELLSHVEDLHLELEAVA